MSEQDASRPERGQDGQAVLVMAASLHGATADIAQSIGETLAEYGLAAAVIPPGDVSDINGYDAVILGSAVYVGHWLDEAKDLAERYRSSLAARPVWMFPADRSASRRASYGQRPC